MIHSVIQLLIKDSKTAAKVGRNKANTKVKIYPVLADKDEEAPYTVLALMANEPLDTKKQVSALDRVTFDTTTFGKEYHEVDEIDNAMRFCLDGFAGVSAGLEIEIWFVTQKDGYDERGYLARISTYNAHVKRSA